MIVNFKNPSRPTFLTITTFINTMEEDNEWNGLNCWDGAGAKACGRAVDAVNWGARSCSDVILRVLLVLPHILFLAHTFEETPSVKDRAELMYPRGVWSCARGYI